MIGYDTQRAVISADSPLYPLRFDVVFLLKRLLRPIGGVRVTQGRIFNEDKSTKELEIVVHFPRGAKPAENFNRVVISESHMLYKVIPELITLLHELVHAGKRISFGYAGDKKADGMTFTVLFNRDL